MTRRALTVLAAAAGATAVLTSTAAPAQAMWSPVNVAVVSARTPTLDAFGITCRAKTYVIGNPITTTRITIQRLFRTGWGAIPDQYGYIEEPRYAEVSSRYHPGLYRCSAQVSFVIPRPGEDIIKHSGARHSHSVLM